MQWTFDQEQIVVEGLRLHKSNQWIADRTGHSIPAIKRKKHNIQYAEANPEPDMPTKTELQKRNELVIAAMFAAGHGGKETKLRTVT